MSKKTKGAIQLAGSFALGLIGGFGITSGSFEPNAVGVIALLIFAVPSFFLARFAAGNLAPKDAEKPSAKKWTSIPRNCQAALILAVFLVLGAAFGGTVEDVDSQPDAAQAPPVVQQEAEPEQTTQDSQISDDGEQPDTAAEKTEPVEEAKSAANQAEGTLKVHFIDVGQGDSEFLELPDGKTMLVDAGESSEAGTVAGYIGSLGYSKIDYVVATHPHDDHIGGMYGILSKFDVGQIWAPKANHDTATYENFLDAVAAKGLKIKAAVAGKTVYESNGCKIEVLSPADGASYGDMNDWSVILRITFGKEVFLLTGDASSGVISAANPGDVDVLKAGHHGSETSIDVGIVSTLSPEFAVISCGAGNQYGHPDESVLDALSDAKVYRTDEDGTIVATCDGSEVTWKTGVTAPRAEVAKAPARDATEKTTEKKSAQAETTGKADGDGPVVYITKTGEKYHADGCSSLRKSKIEISLSDAKARGYEPCKRCNPPA